MHHYLQNHGMGETDDPFHADNCVGEYDLSSQFVKKKNREKTRLGFLYTSKFSFTHPSSKLNSAQLC